MILSDREIRAAIARNAMKITPEPRTEAWSSTAVDLHLSSDLALWQPPGGKGIEVQVCPALPGYNYNEIVRAYGKQTTIGEDGYTFKPQKFLLGWTVEKISLPHQSRIAARVEGKSSLARLGIGVHVTAPTIHAGFGYKEGDEQYEGTELQLEIWNLGKLPIVLDPDILICQLIFELVDGTPEQGYGGQ